MSLVNRTPGYGPPVATSRAAAESIAQLPSGHSPKMKIVQSMLHSLVGDSAPDSTMIFSHTLPSRIGDAVSDSGVEEKVVRLPALVLQGRSLAALALCHEIETAFDHRRSADAMPSSIADLRRCLEQELLEPDIELVAPDLRLRPVSRRNVLIGRPSSQCTADISVNCRWFSRADKSLQLSSEVAGWFVEDLGSANGSYIGEKLLRRGDRFALPLGLTTVEIGRSFDRRSPVILHFNRAADDVVAVTVSVGAAHKAGWETWPSLEEDLSKRWVVFRDEFLLGSQASEKLGIEPQSEQAVVTFRGGYWISPRGGSAVRLDGVTFHSAVPLPHESELEVGSSRFRIERASNDASDALSNADSVAASREI